MNILQLITNADRIAYVENYNYETNFKLSALFPAQKTENMKVEMSRLVENGNLPVMANFHAFDTEAKIGDRTNYREIEFEKLLIKEKLNQTERIAYLLGSNPKNKQIIDFIYDDMSNLISRVLVRAELANNQVLSTGKLEINENNFKTVVDFGYKKSTNDIALSGWGTPAHDIIGDLNNIVEKASKAGKKITRALTSSAIVQFMVNNDGIKAFFKDAGKLLTKKAVLTWVNENFGIAFEVNDDVYKTSALDTTAHRFYPENKISFFGGNSTLGKGLYGVTPEELKLNNGVATKGMVTITQWETPDPVATWTKASAVYLPVVADIDGLFIATITK